MLATSKKDRYRIIVTAEPGRRDRFRWEIEPPAKSDPRLVSGYVFENRQAAVVDARFFLLRDGRQGVLTTSAEDRRSP